MKYVVYSLMLLIACNTSNQGGLEGVYTSSYEHEFGKTEDTLTVEKLGEGHNVYQINRHSGVIRKMDGKEFPKELLTENWTLDYDKDKQVLNERKKGKTLLWNDEKKELVFGDFVYHKIK